MAAFLTYDEEHHRVAILDMPHLPPQPRATPGVDHVAFTYGSLDERLGTWERLGDAGVEPVWAINHGATTSLHYRDPDAKSSAMAPRPGCASRISARMRCR